MKYKIYRYFELLYFERRGNKVLNLKQLLSETDIFMSVVSSYSATPRHDHVTSEVLASLKKRL